ncbi:MAG: hypothetical protein M1826_005251 [Phylliscum demangeonii]|nr:MAG: hypothetical protein M1826_005251 [Phylliscum demangeonii]
MPSPRTRSKAFRFLDLPGEIRVRIYRHVLLVDRIVDLDITNAAVIHPRLQLFRTCRQIYAEAFPVFYGRNTFRAFPTSSDFVRKRHTLLGRLNVRARSAVTRLELRLGPHWSAPPRSWNFHARNGFADATSVRHLIVFVECDPSHDVFQGFRQGKHVFTAFATEFMKRLLAVLPSLERVQFDAYPSVSRESLLMCQLADEARSAKKSIAWGPTWQMRERQGQTTVRMS